jgi:transcriptional regulator with XRE-family HTH domain
MSRKNVKFSEKKGGNLLIYSRIKEISKKKGVSIRKLESDLGFSSGSVCKWDISMPSFDRIVKVANYLSVPLDELKNEIQQEIHK